MKSARVGLLAAIFLLTFPASGQSPSLTETFDWIANTLRTSEGNNTFTHRPVPRPYVKQWVDMEIDPYHTERITTFLHSGCRLEFDVEELDNDMGLLLGKYFSYKRMDTFDLKDIDSKSIAMQHSCEPIDTSSGAIEPWNCQDTQGKIVVFRTIDAKAQIHREGKASSGKSMHGLWGVLHHDKYNLDEMCKEAKANGAGENGAYCDQSETNEKARDVTSATLGFSTSAYANRFANALRHAVDLCGGHTSAF